jgi:lysylphosphatidylglycerol synthetase-like protein (DUF2156 family)
VTSDFQIGSIGRELFLFFQLFFKIKNVSWKQKLEDVKCCYSIGKLNQRAVKAFTALWLALFSHSDKNSPKQKWKSFLWKEKMFRVSRYTWNKYISCLA